MTDLRSAVAFGVAGNMTGHLEQAGEAGDFVGVSAAADRPKGMFPIYLPGLDHRLGSWPFSATTLRLPDATTHVQPEPEVALRVALQWDAQGVCGLQPLAFAAADDTSLRKPADKIQHKKNWGAHAKGLAEHWIDIDRFDASGILERFRLACWLVRDGVCHAYGEDSAVRDYGTHYGPLVDWMVDRLRHQVDEGPLDHLSAWLGRIERPREAVLLIGATRYTDFGQSTYVAPGDEVVVTVYDGAVHAPEAVARAVADGAAALPGASVLRRRVVAA
ncbi:MAG: hypothetical protein KTR31_19960 [Myxococcales bacterium]|nr:hypothetical protein [Myxococcales bacterium]